MPVQIPRFSKRYGGPRAVASIAFPGELLGAIDVLAKTAGMTRNAFVVAYMGWVVDQLQNPEPKP